MTTLTPSKIANLKDVRLRAADPADVRALARIRTRAFVEDQIREWASFSNEELWGERWVYAIRSNAYTCVVATVDRAAITTDDPDTDVLADTQDPSRTILGYLHYRIEHSPEHQPKIELPGEQEPPDIADVLEREEQRRVKIVGAQFGQVRKRNMSSASIAARSPGGKGELPIPDDENLITIDANENATNQPTSSNENETSPNTPFCYMNYVAVHPLGHRRGIGRILMREVQSRCAQIGVQAYLESSLIGRPFYFAHGFTQLPRSIRLTDPLGRAPDREVPALVWVPPPPTA
ncbi:hypothetical protein PYCC9005_003473 [Savitreella phatthalungensis]